MRVLGHLIPFIFLLLLSGCASIFDIKPKQEYSFLQGKKVFLSKQKNSEVKLEIAQDTYKQKEPFLILISAKAKNVIFDSSQIRLLQNENIISPLAPQAILSSGYNFKNSLENFNIPTPPIASSSYNSGALFTLYGNILLFNNSDTYFKESEFSRKILFSNYLKKTTLNENDFLGGFVVFLPKITTNKTTLRFEVDIEKEKHYFNFDFIKDTNGK